MTTIESLVAAAAAHNEATAILTKQAQEAKAETEQFLDTKQDKLVAGEGIAIAEDGKTLGVTPDTFVKLGAMNNMRGDINAAIRLINRDYEGDTHYPIFRFGSQHIDGDIRSDRWFSDLLYDSIEFTGAPGNKTRLAFARGTSDTIVRKEELDSVIGTINSVLENL